MYSNTKVKKIYLPLIDVTYVSYICLTLDLNKNDLKVVDTGHEF